MLHRIWKDQYFDTFPLAKLKLRSKSYALQNVPIPYGVLPFAPAPSNSKAPLWQMFVQIYLK